MSDKNNAIHLAPEDCGLGHACGFCPVEAQCERDKPAHSQRLIRARLASIESVIIVMANKGGVGKSTVAAHLAVALADQGYRPGLADADIHGPNAPRLFGLHETRVRISAAGIDAPRAAKSGVKVGSLGYFLAEPDTPVVWRDAYKHDYIHHMISSFDWGPLDVLVIDMPPGTGNELITLTDLLEGTSAHALLVSTADAIALQDSLKAARFCRERGLPVLGVVENFAGITCPHCGEDVELFPQASEFTEFERAGISCLARLPFSAEVAHAAAAGEPGLSTLFSALAERCIDGLRKAGANAVRNHITDLLGQTSGDGALLARAERERIEG